MKKTVAVPSAVRSPIRCTSLSVAFIFIVYLLIFNSTATGPKTTNSVLGIQVHRESNTIRPDRGPFAGKTVTLTNLNPTVNAWYLLSVQPVGKNETLFFHLENPKPLQQHIVLDMKYPDGLIVTDGGKELHCPFRPENDSVTVLQTATAVHKSYVPIANGALYLRNRIQGHKTTLEWTTDILRTRIPGGEKIIAIAKDVLFKDRFLSTAALTSAEAFAAESLDFSRKGPIAAQTDPTCRFASLDTADLGIETDFDECKGLMVGQWYSIKHFEGMFVSIIEPDLVSKKLVQLQKRLVNPLDSIEGIALSYLIAFDLDRYEVNFVMGTDHPGVEWSDRVNTAVKVAAIPGPDGFGTVWPLVMTGMVPTYQLKRTVATFTAGFRRYHGAFRYGPLSKVNYGSHYGFIENGVVMSVLQPGLATVIMDTDGIIALKTWQKSDNARLLLIKHARQNGVALVEYDSATGISTAGPFVNNRSRGNWSGSQSDKLRTLRAGIAIQQAEGKRFLIYGYFSTATPSAMATVFLAYRCKYAMLTDMNALEHTYLAIYQSDSSKLRIQHLVKGMEVLDIVNKQSDMLPRFIGYPDNRDFFYLVKKDGS